MPTPPNETVLVDSSNGVCTVTLNRPEALNALNRDMVLALAHVMGEISADDSIRAVVVRGGGDHFMAGGDLKWFKASIDGQPDKSVIRHEFERFIHEVHPIVMHMRQMPKPVIASVAGAVAGFGVSLMLACDLVVAADDSYFTLAYCHIGTSPDGGSTFALPRTVGSKRAFEIALLGDRFGPDVAKDLGLINSVAPAAELEAQTAKLAGRLAQGPTHAYANTKALLNASLHNSLEDQLDAEAK